MLYRQLILLLCIALLLSGCKKASKLGNITMGEYNPDIAFPLVNSTIKAGDLLDSLGNGTKLEEGSDGSLTFIYEGADLGLRSEDITSLIPVFTLPLADTVEVFPYVIPNNAFVDFILVKDGIISIFARNDYTEPVEFTLSIPDFSLNGVPFEKSTIIGTAVPYVDTFHVNDYILSPYADSLHLNYRAKLMNTGTSVELLGATNPVLTFSEMSFRYAEGYLGNGSFQLDRDTVEIDIFNQFSGNVFFEEPSIEVIINNSFGFPIEGKFDVLNAVTIDGTIIPLINNTLNNGFSVNYPSFAEVGQTKQTVFTVDHTNSNINDIAGQFIDFFDYELVPVANPGQGTPLGFIMDTSEITLDLRVELPLYGTVENFTILDTFSISLDIYEKMDYASLKLITDNGFPVDVYTQVYFLNADTIRIDSLVSDFQESLLASGVVDSNGKVIEPTQKITEYELSEDRFNILKQDAKFLSLKTSFSTINNGQQSIRIYSDYEIAMKIGVLAGIRPF